MSTYPRLTGRRRYRVSGGVFRKNRLVLQVEEEDISVCARTFDTCAYRRWRDATPEDLVLPPT